MSRNEMSMASMPLPVERAQSHRHITRDNGRFTVWVATVSLAGDLAFIVLGLLLAFWLRFDTQMRWLGHPSLQTMTLREYHGHITFLTGTLLLILTYSGFYETNRASRLRRVNAMILTRAFFWFVANFALSFELYTLPIVSRIFLCNAFFCTAGTLLAWRWVLERCLELPAIAAMREKRILFVGWSEQAAKMLTHIKVDSRAHYRVMGCASSKSGSYQQEPPGDVPVLGDFAGLPETLSRYQVDLVIAADQNATRDEIHDLVTLCEKEMVHFQIIPSWFQVLVSGLHLETTSGVPMLGINRLPLDSPWARICKRALDIFGSIVGLIISAPIIAIFGMLVYWESPGPIFYRQRRGGLGGEIFNIIKIRSMKLNAERSGLAGWTKKDDDRRLKVGAFMRRWNIDEVPQFLNVLFGYMSLVGPRPERPEFIASFKHEIPHYNARHGVKPGITGWAQVNGLRGDTDLTERIRCDLYYIENWSLTLDCQIMLMTFFKHRNAC